MVGGVGAYSAKPSYERQITPEDWASSYHRQLPLPNVPAARLKNLGFTDAYLTAPEEDAAAAADGQGGGG
jgi:hypothetical protein